MSNAISFSRRRKLSACVAALFAFASAPACATVLVTNCFDHGTGSLRDAVAAAAATSEFIDATALTTGSPGCSSSTITLSTGEIVVNGSLVLAGPGKDKLTVTALNPDNGHQYQNRIFNVKGAGGANISGITISHGVVAQPVALPAKGGCIYSAGAVSLTDVRVADCTARADSDGNALGGGLYVNGGVYLSNSIISGNFADAGTHSGAAFGGGFYSNYQILIKNSSILDNYAGHPGIATGVGGGFLNHTARSIEIEYSTLAHNKAGLRCGGGESTGGKLPVNLINNTIAYNESVFGQCGGLHVEGTEQSIFHNTIAFNRAKSNTAALGAGFTTGSPYFQTYAYVFGNIIRDNLDATGAPADLTLGTNVKGEIAGVNFIARIVGSRFYNGASYDSCPYLAPLRDNGGPTMTMALSKFSRALNKNEGGTFVNIQYDQRGAPRISGKQADVGAYEYQEDDMIFATTFEEGVNCSPAR